MCHTWLVMVKKVLSGCKDLIVKHKAINLKDNTGENLDNLGDSDDFLATTPKARSMKETINRLDFIKI